MQTVAETMVFQRAARKILTDREWEDLIVHFSLNPKAGVSLGRFLRKARVARIGAGKSGGYRVYLVYAGEDLPVFLLTIFAKNQKDDLKPAERAKVDAYAEEIIDEYRRRRDG